MNRTVLLASSAALALLLAGCEGSASTSASTVAPTAPATVAASGTSIPVTESEFTIELPSTTLAAGTYNFVVSNTGQTTHALTIDGPGVPQKTTGDIAPGSTASLTVDLVAGTYRLSCPIDSHASKGMDVNVTVA
jgi:uncharacterized cupredoxin-like copper-binding protein